MGFSLMTMKMRPAFIIIAMVLVILCLGVFSPITTAGGDSHGLLLVSQSILKDGDIKIDEYRDYFTKESGDMHHAWLEYGDSSYHLFPLGVPILSLPLIAIVNLVGIDVQDVDIFLQKGLASFSAVLIFLTTLMIARSFLPFKASIFISFLGFFGTLVSSTVLSGLWSINYEILIVSIIILFLVRLEKGNGAIFHPAVLGLLLFLGFLTRPTFSILIIIFFVYLWLKHRSIFLWAAGVSASFLILFIIFSINEYGSFLPPYYLLGRMDLSVFPIAFKSAIFSSSRNIFVWNPFLFILPFLFYQARNSQYRPLLLALFIAAAGMAIPMFFFPHWTLGHSYGPRGFTTSSYLFLCFGILCIGLTFNGENKTTNFQKILLIITFSFGVFINIQGSINPYAWYWNAYPDIDDYPEKVVFDWRYPQFLSSRGLLEEKYATQIAEIGLDEESMFVPFRGSTLWLGGISNEIKVVNDLNETICATDNEFEDAEFKAFVLSYNIDDEDLTLSLNGKYLDPVTEDSIVRVYSGEITGCNDFSDNQIIMEAQGDLGSGFLLYYVLSQ